MQRFPATAFSAAAALVCVQFLGCASARMGDVRVPSAADQPGEPPA